MTTLLAERPVSRRRVTLPAAPEASEGRLFYAVTNILGCLLFLLAVASVAMLVQVISAT